MQVQSAEEAKQVMMVVLQEIPRKGLQSAYNSSIAVDNGG